MSDSGKKDDDTYEVGYGKPPPAHRFKPGQSGNPKGRAKGTRNLKTDLADEGSEIVMITEGGRRLQVTKQRLALKALFARAAKGDPRAISVILQITERQELASALDTAAKPLPDQDNAILQSYLAQLARKASDGGKP